MKVKISLMAIALVIVLAGNAFAVSDLGLKTTTFTAWSTRTLVSDSTKFGIKLDGYWEADGSLIEMKQPYVESPKMTFVTGASYVQADYSNFLEGERLRFELNSALTEEQKDLISFDYADASFGTNFVEIALFEKEGSFEFGSLEMPELTINSITFLGAPFMGDGLGGTQLSYLGYAPTPIPGTALLLLSSLAGMVGIRRFVS